MIPQPLYQFYPKLQPFVEFNTTITGEPRVGLEYYCSDKGCNCRVVYLMIHSCQAKKCLACITYGWEDFNYYIKEDFLKEEARDFTQGSLMKFVTPINDQNNDILESFQKWISIHREFKNNLFEERYQKFIKKL